MMWELKQRYIGYRVEQYNVIIDVLGEYSKQREVGEEATWSESTGPLERMQKSVISNTFNIARAFKINT